MTTTTKAAHTSGPWSLIKSRTDLRNFLVVDKSGNRISESIGMRDSSLTEANCNACLIAAAPDYFAAVEYWMDQIYDGEPLKDWQVQLLAAHKKAKGDQ